MKKLFQFILFFCLLLISVRANAENIKFVQITDVHLTADSEFSQKVLKSAIDSVNNTPGVSFVVFTGDNINKPSEENLRAFMKIANTLKVPYYIAIGNDDVYKSKRMSKTRYYEIVRSENPFNFQRSGNYKFSKGGFVFLTVDGAKEVIPGTIGYYREDTLAWVDKMLSKNAKKSVVIFQHFPVEYPQGSDSKLKTHRTYKVEDYQKILDKHHNVLAILSGHFHINGEMMKDGVYHISTPSILTVPHSYKIVDIVTTKEFSPIIYTQLKEFELKD